MVCQCLSCRKNPRKRSISSGNSTVKFTGMLLFVKDNHSILLTGLQRGKAVLAGTNHGTHRTSAGLSTQDYDRAEMKTKLCTTIIFPKPLFRGFYSENMLSKLRTHDSEANASGWKCPSEPSKYARHLCALVYFALWFNPQNYPCLVEHLNANARVKKRLLSLCWWCWSHTSEFDPCEQSAFYFISVLKCDAERGETQTISFCKNCSPVKLQ